MVAGPAAPPADAAPTGSPTEVVVLIVAFNSGPHLQAVIDALARQSFTDFTTIVWDNASTDGAVEALRVGPGVRVVRGPDNLGFAAANNRAAALSRAPFIVTLNPDAFPDPDWLEILVGAARRTGAASVASLQLTDEDPRILDGAGDMMSVIGVAWRGGYLQPRSLQPREPVEVFAACAAAALYRREAFEAAGGFDARFFCYHEDVDLGFRLRLNGGRCVLEPRAVVRHVGSASSNAISGFAEYHGMRNRLWTFARDMPLALMPIALPGHILLVIFLLLRAQSPKMREARLRALADGWRGVGPFLAERSRWRPRKLLDLARALSWSPLAISRRRPVYRRLKG
ncbi:MAG TPA: glycosyltransferase family 2 protein [Caulobacteraceae bacterium]|jgi:GT2 family glycosyltransferase|nr:glycosyltransferase family 2 protein [Caulobacteraceae bacterium]